MRGRFRLPIALLALAVVSLAGPALAAAHAQRPTTNPVALATTIAERYWHNVPCHGAVPIVGADPVVVGASMWTYIVSTPAEETALPSCPIYVNRQVWPNWFVDDVNFEQFCKDMVHEYGHLEGYPDEGAKPGTVESESPELATVPVCERYRIVYGRHVFVPRREEAWERAA